MSLIAAAMMGCEFSAPEDVVVVDTGLESADVATGDDDTAAGGSQDDPLDVDDDGDGWTENEGDCDDAAATVHPEAIDGCDGEDEDCDGEVDEDAAGDDDYEPNDTNAHDLGSINDEPTLAIQGLLHNDGDIDRFSFRFKDTWSPDFTLSVALSSIPSGAAYRLSVENLSTGEYLVDEAGDGDLSGSMEESWLEDQSASFAVSISSEGGADCNRNYLLTLELTE